MNLRVKKVFALLVLMGVGAMMAAAQAPSRVLMLHVGGEPALITTKIEQVGTAILLTLDQKGTVILQPTAPFTWEGMYALSDEHSGILPGVVVHQGFTGAGRTTYSVTLGWDNPVQMEFSQAGPSEFGGGGVIFLGGAPDKCTCVQYMPGICTKTQCDNKDTCTGASVDKCDWVKQKALGAGGGGPSTFVSWEILEPGNDVLSVLLD